MRLYRQIRATFDAQSITMYQAFNAAIAEAALEAGRFVAPFSFERMTWVKPSFLWMMERCGWATKPNQERVLAVRMSREGFEQALAQACSTSQSVKGASVLVQWDPERDLRGKKLTHRSLQLGLGRAVVGEYVRDWALQLKDVTPLVATLRDLRRRGEWSQVERRLPTERPYPLSEALARRLGADVESTRC